MEVPATELSAAEVPTTTVPSTGLRGQPTGAEDVLAEAVRRWVTARVPGEPDAADAAVAVALDVFSAGGSAAEACEAARTLVGCWMRHPSRGRPGRRLASAS